MPARPSWTSRDVRGFLADYGIAADELDAAPLGGGCDNLNLRLTVGTRRLVLRRYSHTPEEEIEWELRLIQHLNQRGFPTPVVVATEDGDVSRDFLGRPAALFSFVEGREPSPQSPREAAQVAAAVAEMHLVTRDLRLPYARSHTDWKRLERLERLASRLSSPGLVEMVARVREFKDQFEERLAGAKDDLPTGIVHHDANPGNALLDQKGKLVALLDFDEAHEGELVTDVASLLRLWATPHDWHGLRPDMTEAVISAYHARHPLSAAEWTMLPHFLLFFTLADAAEYVSRSLTSEPTGAPVPGCWAYQRFVELESEREWMKMLRPRA